MRKLVLLSLAAMLAACSSPPKPPVVDGKDRHALNDARSQEVIALKADLANTHEKLRKQEASNAVAAVKVLPASQVVTVLFPYNGTQFVPSWDDQQTLKRLLPTARHVYVRGRTDGRRQSAADEKVALGRAVAAKNWLVAQGVPATKVSVNYVSAGDYIGDNATNYGRTNNRRVEIEVFQ